MKATLTVGDEVRYALAVDGKPVLVPARSRSRSPTAACWAGTRACCAPSAATSTRRYRRRFGKRAAVHNACRELALVLSDGATLRARAYDDGFALRWETALPGRVRIRDEGFAVAFPAEPMAYFLSGPGAHHGYEGLWRHEPISALGGWEQLPVTASLPLVFELDGGAKLALLEADLDDYPALYLAYRHSHPRQLSSPSSRGASLKEAPGGFQRVRPRADGARGRHRRHRRHAPPAVARVRARAARRRPPRERHGDPSRAAARGRAPTSPG